MNERERLIELLIKAKGYAANTMLHLDIDEAIDTSYDGLKADYLLENGVVVLPCGMDNVRKLNVYYKHHIKNKYAIVQYDCQRGKPYKIVSYDIQGKELLQNEDIKLYDYLPSMNFILVADGFNSKEEAEKALQTLKGGVENE